MKILFFFLTSLLSLPLAGEEQPIELGKISWGRDFIEAQKISIQKDAPILLLFQEVPG